MNKSTVFIFAIFVALFVSNAYCAPPVVAPENLQQELVETHEGGVRVKRATCDILSFEAFGIKLNDSACALHCVQLGKRGGRCNSNKVCVCRK